MAVEPGVMIDDGGGPESIEPAESSAESGEVWAGPGIGSVNSEEKLCVLEDSGEKPDDS